MNVRHIYIRVRGAGSSSGLPGNMFCGEPRRFPDESQDRLTLNLAACRVPTAMLRMVPQLARCHGNNGRALSSLRAVPKLPR